MNTADQHRFSSRWGLILSVLGIAVGTGNIWRFPRIAAQNGSDVGAAAFLVAWVIFLALWSVPLIIAEYALGREGRRGIIGTFVRLGGERRAWMGGFVGLVATAIMFYYSVVSGWCFYYLGQAVSRPLPIDTATAIEGWEAFQASPYPLVCHGLAMGAGAFAIRNGVRAIERLSRWLIPTLLVIVVIAMIRALTLPGAFAGIDYLFTADWAQLGTPTVWLEALTQNAWDTGAGWGLILTYAAYMQSRQGAVKNALITGIANNTVSMLAAITIFGTVFAVLGAQMDKAEILQVMRDSGPASTGLTFIWMPRLFAQMPLGHGLAIAFFAGLSFAAFTSLISMIELATRVLVDYGVPRSRATAWVCVVGFVLGIPSAVSLEVLGNQDFVWGVGLMLSGLLISILARDVGLERLRQQFRDDPHDWDPGWAWVLTLRFVVPMLAVLLLGWWMYLSATAYAPERWWDPFDPFSVMTCLVQWGLAIALLYAFRRRLARVR